MRQIKKQIKTLLKPLLKVVGFVPSEELINKNHKDYLLNNIIDLVKKANYEPRFILDIGANRGSWTRKWIAAFPATRAILVEPQEWLKPYFQDLLNEKITYLAAGAGKSNGEFMFTINSDRDDSSSFRFSEKEAHERGFKQVTIPVYSIDTIIDQHKHVPDIIKIDAEGIDLEVLDGASKAFGKTELFFVEVAVNSHTMPNDIKTVINVMDEKGYRVFEFTDLNRPFPANALWLAELAFVKKGGFLDSKDWRF